MKIRAHDAGIPLTETKTNVVPGYVGKQIGAAQIAYERGFITLDRLLPNERKFTMQGTSSRNTVTGATSIDISTGVVRMLETFSDFKNENLANVYPGLTRSAVNPNTKLSHGDILPFCGVCVKIFKTTLSMRF